ncbi:MAG: AAA family ATPase [bacterium]|nr:AAA family ATPase [bacterium]
MKWSPVQAKALKEVSRWLKGSDEQVFRLFGYAGTGKTTLARHLAESIESVRFAAYTGKAAHVMQQMGCTNASTIHSLIYIPKGKSAERLRKLELAYAQMPVESERERDLMAKRISEEKKALKSPSFVLNIDSPLRETELLIIDECSMVSDHMAEDLLHFGCKVLVLGDPAQLPPVRGTGYFTERKPNVLLTEIHRQAADNPIIKLANDIRVGKYPPLGTYGDSVITAEITPEMALAADQIIVGKNKTRHAVNSRMRQLLGYDGEVPNVGERLVCLRNEAELGLLNGSLWDVKEIYDDDDPLCMSISPEDEDWRQDVLAHRGLFNGEEIDHWTRREANEFEYGYALTCHKSQGSQWNNVLVMDESACFKHNARRWMYTALTRAAEKVTVYRP